MKKKSFLWRIYLRTAKIRLGLRLETSSYGLSLPELLALKNHASSLQQRLPQPDVPTEHNCKLELLNCEEYKWLSPSEHRSKYDKKPDMIVCHPAIYEEKPQSAAEAPAENRHTTAFKFGIVPRKCLILSVAYLKQRLKLGRRRLSGKLSTMVGCLKILDARGAILAHDLSGSRGAVSPCLAFLSLPKRAMYASAGMFVLDIGDKFPMEHPCVGHSLRGTSRLRVCKKGMNIRKLHQLVNKPSDKMVWWYGRLRIYNHVLEIESTVVEFWKSFIRENGKCRD
eukprot:scaffold12632_cov52-Attheya_sp.AAC.4